MDLSIFTATAAEVSFTLNDILVSSLCAALLGVLNAFLYTYKNVYTKSFVVTLALLPVIVSAVIMLVNGNVGTGVAVMGAFSLIRFRSAPGSAREIGSIFMAMMLGLACSIPAPLYGAFILIIVAIMTFVFSNTSFGETKGTQKSLKITVPENLDYNGLFDDLLEEYTSKWDYMCVKTKNMGSLFEVEYSIMLKDVNTEKEFLDKIRCRNGNLNIVCGRISVNNSEL